MIQQAEDQTKDNQTIQLNVMLNYGGRREIVDAVKSFQLDGGDVTELTKNQYQIICIQKGCRIQIF